MPIDCNASYVDASEACDGRVLVCLRDTSGSAYFDSFDINGGLANNVGPATTGFVTGGNGPPYTQDYQVDNEPAGFQCFYVPYTVGTQTGDILVIQTTVNNQPSGDACELQFTVPTQAACGDDTDCTETFQCPSTPVALTALEGQDFCLIRSDIGIPDFAGNTCTTSLISTSPVVGHANGPAGQCIMTVLANNLPAVGGTFTIEMNINCCNEAQAVDCVVAEVTVVSATGNCLDCKNVIVSNVSNTTLAAGDTLTFDTAYVSGPLIDDHYPSIKDANGVEVGSAGYVSTAPGGTNSWAWTVPNDCDSADYIVCLRSQNQDVGCEDCELFQITLACDCPDPVIQECQFGQVALTANVPRTLNVSGCECVDTIEWTSPDPELSFNPTTGPVTQVTATTSGNFTVDVECCIEEDVEPVRTITLDCPTITLTDPNQPFTLNFVDTLPATTTNYDLWINGIDTGDSVLSPATSQTSEDVLSTYTSGPTGTFTVELRYFDNGDTSNILSAGICVVNYDFPVNETHENGLTYTEIEALGKASNCYLTDDEYVAQYLALNPDVCYWEKQVINGVDCVVSLPTPLPPSGAIQLPAPSGGDDTPAIENVINNNAGSSFVGTGGVYKLNNLDITVAADIFNVPSVPLSSSTSDVWRIKASNVRIFNSPIDGQTSSGMRFGWFVGDNNHGFHLVKSGLKDVRVTDGDNVAGVFLGANNDFHIACNVFEDILNSSGTGQTARANAIWQSDQGASQGGYIVNNVAINFQSNGNNKDAEFYTRQSLDETTLTVPVKVFANTCIDAGKRMCKLQSGMALVFSNDARWTIKSGNTGMGNRALLSFVEVIQDGGGVASNVRVANNTFTSEVGTGGQMDRIFSMGGLYGGTQENVNIECNHVIIESDDQGTVAQSPSILFGASTGTANSYQGCSFKDNIATGPGGIKFHYNFSSNGLPNTFPAANFDISGNVLSVPWTISEYR